MAEPRLHHFHWQFEAAIDAPVDAPRGVEVPQAVEALVFGLAMAIDDTGHGLRGLERALDDGDAVIEARSLYRKISRRRPRSPQLAGFCGCVSVSADTVSGLNAIWAFCLWAEEYRFPDADPPVVKASVPISLVGLDKRGRLHFRAGHGDPLGHHGD